MQKADLIQKIMNIKTEMEPLATRWAKITKKKYAARFANLENFTIEDLKTHYFRLRAIHTGSWASLKKVWDRLPESQWETTYILDMRHLPEYIDLRAALLAFKHQFMGKKNETGQS